MFRKLIRKLKYKFGPKEVVYENELNHYFPAAMKQMMDSNKILHIAVKRRIGNEMEYKFIISNRGMVENDSRTV